MSRKDRASPFETSTVAPRERIQYGEAVSPSAARWRVTLVPVGFPSKAPRMPVQAGVEPAPPEEEGASEEGGRIERRLSLRQIRPEMADRRLNIGDDDALSREIVVTPSSGQTVTVSKQRSFIYPRTLFRSDTGRHYQTLASETLGYRLALTLQSGGDGGSADDADRAWLQIQYGCTEVGGYRRSRMGAYTLPVIVRESLQDEVEIGAEQVLLLGGEALTGEDASFYKEDSTPSRSWLLWVEPFS